MKVARTIALAAEAVLRAGAAPEQRAARRLGRPARHGPGNGPGKRVLFLTPRSWAAHVQWEAMIGRALMARGAEVAYLTCGGGRQICDRTHLYEGPPMPCRSCVQYNHVSLAAHGHRFDALHTGEGAAPEPEWPELDDMDLAQLQAVSWHGLALGQLVTAPVAWFLCSTDFDQDPLARPTFRRFLRSAASIVNELEGALRRARPDTVVLLNGLFLFESICLEVCRREGIDVVTYERGYVDGTLFFHRGLPASRYDTSALWTQHRHRALSASEDAELDAYLAGRRTGARSVNNLWPSPSFGTAVPQRKFTVLLTNVTWDTAARDRDRCFDGQRDWVRETLRWFERDGSRQLVVRVHPAEVRLGRARSREPIKQFIDGIMPVLPPNIVVIGPEDPSSTYPLLAEAEAALVYTSTAGMEAAILGTPCITASVAQYSDKGFTLDPPNRARYFELLEAVTSGSAAYQPDVCLARRYAHFFFFRAALSCARWSSEPSPGLVRISSDANLLLPGGDPDLDVICRGILTGTPFVRPSAEDVPCDAAAAAVS